MMKKLFPKLHERYVSVKMLHVGFGSHWWHFEDIVFVLTGKVL